MYVSEHEITNFYDYPNNFYSSFFLNIQCLFQNTVDLIHRTELITNIISKSQKSKYLFELLSSDRSTSTSRSINLRASGKTPLKYVCAMDLFSVEVVVLRSLHAFSLKNRFAVAVGFQSRRSGMLKWMNKYLFSVSTLKLDRSLVFRRLFELMHLSTSAECGVHAAILASTVMSSLKLLRLSAVVANFKIISLRLKSL